MDDLNAIDFLGRGWRFPPTFSSHSSDVDMVAGEKDIRESLFILLSTAQGERVMVPTYGCDLHRYVFAELTTGAIAEIRDMVATAILRWEPRIDVLDVTAAADPDEPGLMRIGVDYRIRRTNVRSNIVFPFYFTEGTLVRGP
ncbi:MAG TPA: GPW/gp25 family protein [Allosphingosinicella sp.]